MQPSSFKRRHTISQSQNLKIQPPNQHSASIPAATPAMAPSQDHWWIKFQEQNLQVQTSFSPAEHRDCEHPRLSFSLTTCFHFTHEQISIFREAFVPPTWKIHHDNNNPADTQAHARPQEALKSLIFPNFLRLKVKDLLSITLNAFQAWQDSPINQVLSIFFNFLIAKRGKSSTLGRFYLSLFLLIFC